MSWQPVNHEIHDPPTPGRPPQRACYSRGVVSRLVLLYVRGWLYVAACGLHEVNNPLLAMWKASKICKLVWIDLLPFLVFVCLSFALWLCENYGVSFKRGFFCDDKSIRLPYKHTTVPLYCLVILSAAVPLLMVRFGNVFVLTK